jgi:hypothetical protein
MGRHWRVRRPRHRLRLFLNMQDDDQDQDEYKIPRRLGILVAYAATTASALFFFEVTDSRQTNFALRTLVWAGLILGNYVYAQLWMDEGRARERRTQRARERRRGP